MQETWWEGITSFLCNFWWIVVIVIALLLLIIFLWVSVSITGPSWTSFPRTFPSPSTQTCGGYGSVVGLGAGCGFLAANVDEITSDKNTGVIRAGVRIGASTSIAGGSFL